MNLSKHWDSAYGARGETDLTWFEDVPEMSLRLVRKYLPAGGAMIDVGGGASRLVDHVLKEQIGHVSVLDLAEGAITITKDRLGDQADAASFAQADILIWEPDRTYDLWHDRAVFHFLTEPEDQAKYSHTLLRALRPGGVAIIATFDLTGPERCSDLPVQRYSPETLAERITTLTQGQFDVLAAAPHSHVTPRGNAQPFQFSVFKRKETPE
jgi:SAM-dependent methyltransferase